MFTAEQTSSYWWDFLLSLSLLSFNINSFSNIFVIYICFKLKQRTERKKLNSDLLFLLLYLLIPSGLDGTGNWVSREDDLNYFLIWDDDADVDAVPLPLCLRNFLDLWLYYLMFFIIFFSHFFAFVNPKIIIIKHKSLINWKVILLDHIVCVFMFQTFIYLKKRRIFYII